MEDDSDELQNKKYTITHLRENVWIDHLPKDIWIDEIIFFLSSKEKYALSQMCSFFSTLCNDSILWKDPIHLRYEHLAKIKKTSFPLRNIVTVNEPMPIEIDALQNITYLTELRALDLKQWTGVNVTVLGNILEACPLLGTLKVRGEGLNDEALTLISTRNNLRTLYFQNATLSAQSSVAFGNLTSLTDLSLWKTKGVPFRALSSLTNLHALDIPKIGLSDNDLDFCTNLTKLVDFRLAGNPISDKGLSHLAPLTNLNVLHLGYTQITERGLKATLLFFPDLKELSLVKLSFNNQEDPLNFSQLTSLKTLDLSMAQVSPTHISSLTGIKDLRFYDVELTEKHLESFKSLTDLTTLTVSRSIGQSLGQRLQKALPNLKVFY